MLMNILQAKKTHTIHVEKNIMIVSGDTQMFLMALPSELLCPDPWEWGGEEEWTGSGWLARSGHGAIREDENGEDDEEEAEPEWEAGIGC